MYDNDTLGAYYSETSSKVQSNLYFAKKAFEEGDFLNAKERIKQTDCLIDEHIYLFEEKDFPKLQGKLGKKIIGITSSHYKRIQALMRNTSNVENLIEKELRINRNLK